MRLTLAKQEMLNALGIDPIEYEHDIITNFPRMIALAGITQTLVEMLNIPNYKQELLIDAIYFAAAVGERTIKDAEGQENDGGLTDNSEKV